MTEAPSLMANEELHPRVAEMVERFAEIGDLSMRELPIYNPDLFTEAIGFTLCGDEWIGVLITPWFMNVIALPQQIAAMDFALIGDKVDLTLPSGTWTFTWGGDEVVGRYKMLSLHSPMAAFKTQELARIEAQRRWKALNTPAEGDTASAPSGAPRDPGRRAFFRGRNATT